MSLATTNEQNHASPIVRTTAVPPPELLMQVRALVAKDEDLRGFFVQFKAENKTVAWLRDIVATPLSFWVEDKWNFPQVVEACQYLADEYNQLPEGHFLVNTETGRVELVFSEDDLMDPGFLPRESGGMAQALKRLRPDKEVALVSYHHEKDRDTKVLEALVKRSGGAIQSIHDPRLRMATRQGRTAIAKELSEDSPHELLKRAGGTTGAFLRHFPLCDGEALQDYPEKQVLRGGATFRSQIGVQDAMTINPSYNRLGTLRAAAPQGWVRSICIQLAAHIHREFNAYPTDVEDLDPEVLKASELWIADPDSFSVLKKLSPKTAILPVEGVAPIGLSGLVGELFLDKEFGVETHERFKRWEVVSNVGYTLVIHNWGNVKALPLLGVSAHAEVM